MRVKTNMSSVVYQMEYPGLDAYHFPVGVQHTSPCMSSFWRGQPIRQGKMKEESQ